MTELTELEVGKTYVFKDEWSKQTYIHRHDCNASLISKYYKDGFTIDGIDQDGDGTAIGSIARVIVCKEMKYFKLKEENVVTNKFDKSMLKDGMVVVDRVGERYLVLGVNLVRGSGYNQLCTFKDDLISDDRHRKYDIMEVGLPKFPTKLDIDTWTLTPVWKREEKSPTQLKIEEMESSVAELQKQINELKQM